MISWLLGLLASSQVPYELLALVPGLRRRGLFIFAQFLSLCLSLLLFSVLMVSCVYVAIDCLSFPKSRRNGVIYCYSVLGLCWLLLLFQICWFYCVLLMDCPLRIKTKVGHLILLNFQVCVFWCFYLIWCFSSVLQLLMNCRFDDYMLALNSYLGEK